MFEEIDLETVVVTGPQRAGTRITSKVIEHDLGYRYIDEWEMSFEDALKEKGAKVIQAPKEAYKCHTLNKDIFIVFCMRDIKDILASQDRINWDFNEVEVKKYNKLKKYYDTKLQNACEIKYQVWNSFQKSKIDMYFESNFSVLSEHPLYIKKNKRLTFAADQTKI